jgi:hypothetical protein
MLLVVRSTRRRLFLAHSYASREKAYGSRSDRSSSSQRTGCAFQWTCSWHSRSVVVERVSSALVPSVGGALFKNPSVPATRGTAQPQKSSATNLPQQRHPKRPRTFVLVGSQGFIADGLLYCSCLQLVVWLCCNWCSLASRSSCGPGVTVSGCAVVTVRRISIYPAP